MTALITISEYVQLTNDDPTTTLPGTYVTGLIEAVSEDLQEWCGRLFGVQTVTDERVDARSELFGSHQPALYVRVKNTPLASVSALSVWYALDTDPTTISLDEAVVDTQRIGFYAPFGVFGLWQPFFQRGKTYQGLCSYTGGEAVPSTIKRAAALLVQESLALDSATSFKDTDAVESLQVGEYRETKAKRDLAASEGLGLGTQNSVLAARLARRYRPEGAVLV
jgi:hypothetical protein